MNKISLFLFMIVFNVSLFSQNNIYKNKTYKKSINTVLIYKKGWELSHPIINLNTNDKIEFKFDELIEGKTNDYSYKLIHCNSNWEQSDLLESDYIEGFNDNPVSEYKNSFNTTINYVHYTISLPNYDIKLLASGNYIIYVYENNDDSKPIITWRFTVVEQKIDIIAKVSKPKLVEHIRTGQDIELKINPLSFKVNNPTENLKIVISQNNRHDNVANKLKINFLTHNQFIYRNSKDLIFAGGNEFLFFGIKNRRFASQNVQKIYYSNNYYYANLAIDEFRNRYAYKYHKDLNGNRLIKIDGGISSNIEADYFKVKFSYKSNDIISTGKLYVFGALTNWNLNDEALMKYNFEKKMYETTLLLKQGYYNYDYVYVDNQNKKIDRGFIRGNNFQTENNYIIYVYYSDMQLQYDRLIGVKIINSLKKI